MLAELRIVRHRQNVEQADKARVAGIRVVGGYNLGVDFCSLRERQFSVAGLCLWNTGPQVLTQSQKGKRCPASSGDETKP